MLIIEHIYNYNKNEYNENIFFSLKKYEFGSNNFLHFVCILIFALWFYWENWYSFLKLLCNPFLT
jgi:hypothetical protein